MLFTWAILWTEYFLVCISLYFMQKLYPEKSERAKGESSYHMHTTKTTREWNLLCGSYLRPRNNIPCILFCCFWFCVCCCLLLAWWMSPIRIDCNWYCSYALDIAISNIAIDTYCSYELIHCNTYRDTIRARMVAIIQNQRMQRHNILQSKREWNWFFSLKRIL